MLWESLPFWAAQADLLPPSSEHRGSRVAEERAAVLAPLQHWLSARRHFPLWDDFLKGLPIVLDCPDWDQGC